MATDKKVVGDLGSQLVEEMRLQLNRLTEFVDTLIATAALNGGGDAFEDAVAALDVSDHENILTRITMPPAPKLDDGS